MNRKGKKNLIVDDLAPTSGPVKICKDSLVGIVPVVSAAEQH